MQLTVLSWNVFHGRDFPPDPALRTWRSRLLRASERSETHVQVNRDLLAEFAAVLCQAEWDAALLQECPPRWWRPLAEACEAEPHGVLTSRNSLPRLRALAARLNPDLVSAGEGGSNLTLVRGDFPVQGTGNSPGVSERRELEIHGGRPERRAMGFVRLGGGDAGLCVANLHATNDRPAMATADVLRAAEAASEWAGKAPLIFGGDLNLRPAETPDAFEQLRERFGLTGTTAPAAIDHLLSRGLDVVAPPTAWPPERREVPCDGLALRLSDHAPVQAEFATHRAR